MDIRDINYIDELNSVLFENDAALGEPDKLATTYDRVAFVNQNWDWHALIRDKIIDVLFYYAKENYVDKKPQRLENWQGSIITGFNFRRIPKGQLSAKNLHTNFIPNTRQKLKILADPRLYYDDKIDGFLLVDCSVGQTS